jgi:hypothetical protein
MIGLLAAMLPLPAIQQGQQIPVSPPPLPYLDWKACPFEGCTYGSWTARKAVVVYDTWKSPRREIARLAKGEQVTGLTGVAITERPGVIRMDRAYPQEGLKKGDKILTYTYLGEGECKVWANGKFYDDFDISFAKWPDGNGCNGDSCAATYVDLGKKVWWAQVRLKSGRTGWVNMNESAFDGVDALG